MKSLSVLVLALAGLAAATPVPDVAAASDVASTDAVGVRADLTIEFFIERDYTGEGDEVRTIEENECSESSHQPQQPKQATRHLGTFL